MKKININKLPKKLLLGVGLLLLLLLFVYRFSSNTDSAISQSNNAGVKLASSVDEVAVDRTFEYPLRDKEGNEVSKLRVTVENAALQKEIIVKGKKNRAIEGRVFLTLNIKVQNQFNKPLDINTRDYFRITVNGNEEERLAPEIHNDPVSVQAISTKLTRVGFTLYEEDKNIVLYVGEINSDKERIELDLQSR